MVDRVLIISNETFECKLLPLALKGPRKAVWGHKIAPNHFKTTLLVHTNVRREETHLFKTFSGLQLGCNAFILAKSLEIMVN